MMVAARTLARRGCLPALALCLASATVSAALAGCQQADAAPEPKPRHLDLSTLALVTARGHEAAAVPAMEPEIEQVAHREPRAAAQPLPREGGATQAVARASLRAEPGG